MALDKTDPFPNLPRRSFFAPRSVKEFDLSPQEFADGLAEDMARANARVTKKPSVTELRETVTEIEAAPKRGRRPRGERPLTPAEKQRLYRERKRRAK